ncbi:MAG: LysR family transcriptional regulator [Deinococcales bacterium]
MGSISQAALALGSSQPALSRQLSALQDLTGDKLYERNATGIELTPAGRALLPYACRVAQGLLEARHFVMGSEELSKRQSSIVIGISPHLSHYSIKFIQTFSQQPRFKLRFVEASSQDLEERVLERELNMALILETAKPKRAFRYRRFGQELMCLALRPDHPLAMWNYLPLLSLQGEQVILPPSQSQLYVRFMEQLANAKVSPVSLMSLPNPQTVKLAVLEGLGVGVSLQSGLEPYLKAQLIKQVLLENNGFVLSSFLIHHDLISLDLASRQAIELVYKLSVYNNSAYNEGVKP